MSGAPERPCGNIRWEALVARPHPISQASMPFCQK